jgi:hypothetical protein
MKKYYLLVLLLLSLNITSTAYAEPDISKGIERSVVTKIEWDDKNKVILIHAILVEKYINQPIVVHNDFITPVRVEVFKDSTLTNEEARNFAIQLGSLGIDHIFGKKAKVFKDFSESSFRLIAI